MKTFDLIYVDSGGKRTMGCGILDTDCPEGAKLVGPFPADEAGPKIAEALVNEGVVLTKEEAETAYIFEHFKNMHSGQNKSGQAYPFRC